MGLFGGKEEEETVSTMGGVVGTVARTLADQAENTAEVLRDTIGAGRTAARWYSFESMVNSTPIMVLSAGVLAGVGAYAYKVFYLDKKAVMRELEKDCEIRFQFCATHIPKTDLISKADPFLVFSYKDKEGRWHVVRETEAIEDEGSPSWEPFVAKRSVMTGGGEIDTPLRVECYDADSKTKKQRRFIGAFETTVDALLHDSVSQFPLIDPAKVDKEGYNDSGTVTRISVVKLQ